MKHIPNEITAIISFCHKHNIKTPFLAKQLDISKQGLAKKLAGLDSFSAAQQDKLINFLSALATDSAALLDSIKIDETATNAPIYLSKEIQVEESTPLCLSPAMQQQLKCDDWVSGTAEELAEIDLNNLF
jgi:hypothetical protein